MTELSTDEAAVVARFEAAADAEESLRSRVIRALVQSDYDSPVEDLGPILAHECSPEYERYADAAIATMRGEA